MCGMNGMVGNFGICFEWMGKCEVVEFWVISDGFGGILNGKLIRLWQRMNFEFDENYAMDFHLRLVENFQGVDSRIVNKFPTESSLFFFSRFDDFLTIFIEFSTSRFEIVFFFKV